MFFGRKMREIRKVKKLSMAELANKIGVSESYISLLETEKREPLDGKHLFGIAKILECELEDLTDSPVILNIARSMYGDPLAGKKQLDADHETPYVPDCANCAVKDSEICYLREQLSKALDRIPRAQ